MIGTVTALEPADYQNWLSGGAAGGTMAENGAKLFTDLSCNTCHLDAGQGRGPVLKGLYGKQVLLQGLQPTTVDDAYIRESILNPQAKIVSGFQPIMPTFQGLVTEEQLLQLIAYIKSLSDASATPAPTGATAPGVTTPQDPVKK
jgi:cytochrome c oxidase subunit 2